MKIILTRHVVEEKIPALKLFGWTVTKKRITETIKKPDWKGLTNKGQLSAMSLIDSDHVLLVVYVKEGGIIKVITVYVTRRGRYGSTL